MNEEKDNNWTALPDEPVDFQPVNQGLGKKKCKFCKENATQVAIFHVVSVRCCDGHREKAAWLAVTPF